jgi:protein ImuA
MSIPNTDKTNILAELRRRISGLDAAGRSEDAGDARAQTVRLDASALAAALPDGGLACAALHEVRARDYSDISASIGFAAALATSCARHFPAAPVLWCESDHTPFDIGHFYGPGLAAFGLDPARLILVSAATPVDLLWTMEEALRLGAFAAVLGEIDGCASALTLTATRRLQLAAEAGGRPAFLLTGHAANGASAAVTRWSVASAPSRSLATNTPSLIGRACWRVTLEKSRGSLAGAMTGNDWRVEWDAYQQRLRDVPDAPMRIPSSDLMQAV